MKKILFVFTFLILCILLTACDPLCTEIENKIDVETVTTVELINYHNPDQKSFKFWVFNHTRDLKPFKAENSSVIETLSDDKKLDFINQLKSNDLLFKYYSYDAPKGICLRLSYPNNDFLIINCEPDCAYIGKFAADGSVADFYGYSYCNIELVNCYFNYKISTESYSLDPEINENEVSSVSLINYENPNQVHPWLKERDQRYIYTPFDINNYTVIETLGTEKELSLFEQVKKAEMLSIFSYYDSPKGLCIKITYKNGNYLIINCNSANTPYDGYIGEYTADGAFYKNFGCYKQENYHYFEEIVHDFFGKTAMIQ